MVIQNVMIPFFLNLQVAACLLYTSTSSFLLTVFAYYFLSLFGFVFLLRENARRRVFFYFFLRCAARLNTFFLHFDACGLRPVAHSHNPSLDTELIYIVLCDCCCIESLLVHDDCLLVNLLTRLKFLDNIFDEMCIRDRHLLLLLPH